MSSKEHFNKAGINSGPSLVDFSKKSATKKKINSTNSWNYFTGPQNAPNLALPTLTVIVVRSGHEYTEIVHSHLVFSIHKQFLKQVTAVTV